MRVTHLGTYHAALRRITGALEDVSGAQGRIASGKRLQRPSDDPTGMGRALELRAVLRVRDQESRNANDGAMWVNLADTKLQEVVQSLQRARELAVRGASFTDSNERNAIAVEISAIRDSVLASANARHQDRGLFAGFSGADTVQQVGGVWSYQGDTGDVKRRIGDREVVTVNVTGDVAFGFTGPKDVFTVLDDLETALLTDTTSGIDAAIGEIDGSMDTLLTSLATLGSSHNRIEQSQARLLGDIETIHRQLGSIEDVDLTEAVMELQMSETAYQAALAAFARSSQSSLVDFLR